MNEHPILFSTHMVQALLEGRKTMTRRILKVKGCKPFIPDASWDKETIEKWNKDYFPYGKVGDLLWVRETWSKVTSKIQTHPVTIFKANFTDTIEDLTKYMKDNNCTWKPSIHMPKAAARIWLKITDISVERLQDISEEDAQDEGVLFIDDQGIVVYKSYLAQEPFHWSIRTAKKSFETLWQKINGFESWNTNPWVWVIRFDVISTTGRPQICKICGCTDDDCEQCIEKTGEPCEWIEEDLCSACLATKEGDI